MPNENSQNQTQETQTQETQANTQLAYNEDKALLWLKGAKIYQYQKQVDFISVNEPQATEFNQLWFKPPLNANERGQLFKAVLCYEKWIKEEDLKPRFTQNTRPIIQCEGGEIWLKEDDNLLFVNLGNRLSANWQSLVKLKQLQGLLIQSEEEPQWAVFGNIWIKPSTNEVFIYSRPLYELTWEEIGLSEDFKPFKWINESEESLKNLFKLHPALSAKEKILKEQEDFKTSNEIREQKIALIDKKIAKLQSYIDTKIQSGLSENDTVIENLRTQLSDLNNQKTNIGVIVKTANGKPLSSYDLSTKDDLSKLESTFNQGLNLKEIHFNTKLSQRVEISNRNLTFTVGNGGDFAELQDCINALSKYAITTNDRIVHIKIKHGYTLRRTIYYYVPNVYVKISGENGKNTHFYIDLNIPKGQWNYAFLVRANCRLTFENISLIERSYSCNIFLNQAWMSFYNVNITAKSSVMNNVDNAYANFEAMNFTLQNPFNDYIEYFIVSNFGNMIFGQYNVINVQNDKCGIFKAYLGGKIYILHWGAGNVLNGNYRHLAWVVKQAQIHLGQLRVNGHNVGTKYVPNLRTWGTEGYIDGV